MKPFHSSSFLLASCLFAAACGPRAPSTAAASPEAEAEKPALEPLPRPSDFASWKPLTSTEGSVPLAITVPERSSFSARTDKSGVAGVMVRGTGKEAIAVEIFPTKMKSMAEVKKSTEAQKIVREEDDLLLFEGYSDLGFVVFYTDGDNRYVCKNSNTAPLYKGEKNARFVNAAVAACRTLAPASLLTPLTEWSLPLSIGLVDVKGEKLEGERTFDNADVKGAKVSNRTVTLDIYPANARVETIASAKKFLVEKGSHGSFKVKPEQFSREEPDVLVWSDGTSVQSNFLVLAKRGDVTYACSGLVRNKEIDVHVDACKSLAPAK